MRNTLITIRGRHRRSFWLGFGPVAIALILLALLLVPVTAQAAPVRAEYGGARWYDAGRTICVDVSKVRSSTVGRAVKESVVNMRDRTKLKLTIRGSQSCYSLGYSYRIVVYDGYYGRNGHLAWTDWKGGFSWGKVRTAGPWTQNGYTWRIKSPVIVRFNKSYSHSLGVWSSLASHELGHAVGLGHNSRCASTLQASLSKARSRGCTIYRNLTWRDRVGYWTSDPGINQIYKNG